MSLPRALALAALLVACAWAQAGPVTVRAADGGRWVLNDDDDPTTVERRLPNGALDPNFGRNGRAEVDLGGTDVTVNALRVETTGRVWVAGTTTGAISGPTLLRLQPNGQPDTAWGVGGRSTASPAGQRLTVVDMLPQADGSVWLLGTLIGAQGEGDAGLWRLRPDGALDYAFGIGGLWKRSGTERSRALSLAAGPDGMLGIGMEVLGSTPRREIYLLSPGEKQPQLDPRRPAASNEDDDEPFLFWTGVTFWWQPGPQTAGLTGLPVIAMNARANIPGSAPSDAGHTALNPFSDPTPAASSPSAVQSGDNDGLPWGWLVAGVAALVILGTFWRRG